MNPIASASMTTAAGVARIVSRDAPPILWPDDWPASELVAWTRARMPAETLPGPGADAAVAPTVPFVQREEMVGATGIEPVTPTMST